MSKLPNTRKSPVGADAETLPKVSSVKTSHARQKAKAPDVKSSSNPKADKRSGTVDRPTHPSRSSTKLGEIIAILRTKQGASIDQIAEAVGWQRHSVHGLISGKIRKKQGLNVVNDLVDGIRVYRIAK